MSGQDISQPAAINAMKDRTAFSVLASPAAPLVSRRGKERY